jgi:hypothetical protein
MALDPRRTARTAVLTPVGFGVIAFDAANDWATERGRQANARVAPLRTKLQAGVQAGVRSVIEAARAEAQPTADQIELRVSSLTRRGRSTTSDSQ